jgi:hypothetical protein
MPVILNNATARTLAMILKAAAKEAPNLLDGECDGIVAQLESGKIPPMYYGSSTAGNPHLSAAPDFLRWQIPTAVQDTMQMVDLYGRIESDEYIDLVEKTILDLMRIRAHLKGEPLPEEYGERTR